MRLTPSSIVRKSVVESVPTFARGAAYQPPATDYKLRRNSVLPMAWLRQWAVAELAGLKAARRPRCAGRG